MRSHMEKPWPGIDLPLVWEQSIVSILHIHQLSVNICWVWEKNTPDRSPSFHRARIPSTHTPNNLVFLVCGRKLEFPDKNPQRHRENIQTVHRKARAGTLINRATVPLNRIVALSLLSSQRGVSAGSGGTASQNITSFLDRSIYAQNIRRHRFSPRSQPVTPQIYTAPPS